MNMSTTDRHGEKAAEDADEDEQAPRRAAGYADGALRAARVRRQNRHALPQYTNGVPRVVPEQAPNLRARITRRDPWTFPDFEGIEGSREDDPGRARGRVDGGPGLRRPRDPEPRRNGARPAPPRGAPPLAGDTSSAGAELLLMIADRRQHLIDDDRAGPRRGNARPLRPVHGLLARLPGRRPGTRRRGRRRASPPLVPPRSPTARISSICPVETALARVARRSGASFDRFEERGQRFP